jgi:hypothetical protein
MNFFRFFLVSVIAIVAVSICCEVLGKSYSILPQLLIIKNLRNLFTISNPKQEDVLAYMTGFKSLVILVTLLDHFLIIHQQFPFRDGQKSKEFNDGFFHPFVLNATLGTSPLILISSFLCTRNLYELLAKNKKKILASWYLLLIHRILRFLPSLIVLLLIEKIIMLNFFVKIFQAPFLFVNQLPRHLNNYWIALTYFENYISTDTRFTVN